MAKFDTDDAAILTRAIERAFRAQRMGNYEYRDAQISLVRDTFGNDTAKRLKQSLRDDALFVKTEMYEGNTNARTA